MLTDKRRNNRFGLHMPALLKVKNEGASESQVREGATVDVSSSGAFLATRQPLKPDTAVELDMVLPLEHLKNIPGDQVRIQLSGVVVRSTSEGMGISFDEEFRILPGNESNEEIAP